ncbi:MAG: PD40 domain-containing protein [Chloroflexi bacterium]|nr:PD40 domain-containing protein [Chloroflexota bacterium]
MKPYRILSICILLSILAVAFGAAAQNTVDVATPAEVVTTDAPTQGLIAFSIYQNGIWVMNADGTNLRQFIDDPRASNPTWSPDGRQLLYLLGGYQLFLVNADRSDKRPLVLAIEGMSLGGYSDFTWSPDGTQIAFVSNEVIDGRGGLSRIYIMDVDGTNLRRVSASDASAVESYWPLDSSTQMEPDWSPDGLQIVFNGVRPGSWELYVMNTDGSNPHPLTVSSDLGPSSPRWSPDGSQIVFVRDGAIYVMDADGSSPHAITTTDSAVSALSPDWSPDGTRIVFTNNDEDGDREIYVMNAEGSDPRQLTENTLIGEPSELAWQSVANVSEGTTAPTQASDNAPAVIGDGALALTETFVSPDSSISIGYPQGWFTTYQSGESSSGVYIANYPGEPLKVEGWGEGEYYIICGRDARQDFSGANIATRITDHYGVPPVDGFETITVDGVEWITARIDGQSLNNQPQTSIFAVRIAGTELHDCEAITHTSDIDRFIPTALAIMTSFRSTSEGGAGETGESLASGETVVPTPAPLTQTYCFTDESFGIGGDILLSYPSNWVFDDQLFAGSGIYWLVSSADAVAAFEASEAWLPNLQLPSGDVILQVQYIDESFFADDLNDQMSQLDWYLDAYGIAAESEMESAQIGDQAIARVKVSPSSQFEGEYFALKTGNQVVMVMAFALLGEYEAQIPTVEAIVGSFASGCDGSIDSVISISAQSARPQLTLENISQARELLRVDGGPTDIYSYDYSPDGSTIAVNTVAGLKLFSTLMPAEPRFIGDGPVRSVAFSADGKRLFTAHEDGLLRIWDVVSGTLIQEGLGATKIFGFLFSPDRSLLVTYEDGGLQLRDSESLEAKLSIEDDNSAMVFPSAFTADNTHIVGLGFNADYTESTIYIWNAQTGQISHRIEGLAYTYDFQISRDGQYIAASHLVDSAAMVGLWSLADGTRIADLKPDGNAFDTFTAHSFDQADHLLTARSNLVSWGGDGNQLSASGEVSDWPLTALDFSSDWSLLLGGSLESSLIAIDPASGTAITSLLEGEGVLSRIVFSPDSTTFLTYRTLGSDQSPTGETISSLRLWGVPQARESIRVYAANAALTLQSAPEASTVENLTGSVFFTTYVNDAGVDIYKFDLQGGSPLRLTTNPERDINGVLSPDGTQIAYISVKNEQNELAVVDIYGENNRILLSGAVSLGFQRPIWSPDGTKIAGTGIVDDRPAILIVNADGSDLRNLTPGKSGTMPKFSPDGMTLMFQVGTLDGSRYTGQSIATINIDGSGYRELARELYLSTSVSVYDWSPDGNLIAYTSEHTGAPEINIMNADGSGNRQVTNRLRGSGSYNPVWSPDGQSIMFSTEHTEVNVMRADGSDVRQLTFATSQPLSWSPDGQFILYLSNETSFPRLRVVDKSGENDRLIAVASQEDVLVFEDVFWLLSGAAGVPAPLTPFVLAAPTLAPALAGPSLDLDAIQPVTRNTDWTPIVTSVDGVEMVVVPPGCFVMGEPESRDRYLQPTTICFDKAYLLDRYEVTNQVTDLFNYRPTHDAEDKLPNYPRANIDWVEAGAFCTLRGGRLPTEAEWEYAARGPDALLYPQGATDPGYTTAYSAGARPVGLAPHDRTWTDAFDMLRNVDEWTNSLYTMYPYDATDGREDPNPSISRVVRGVAGALWYRSGASDKDWGYSRGFRCVYGGVESQTAGSSSTTVQATPAPVNTEVPPAPTSDATAPAVAPSITTNTSLPTNAPTATNAPITCPGTLTSRLVVGLQARVTPGEGANRVRSQPTTGASEQGRIPPGGIFEVLEGPVCANSYAWWRVNYQGLQGWTAEADFETYWLEPLTGGAIAQPTVPPNELYVGGQAVVFTEDEGLKLRTSTSTGATVIENLPPGTIVTLLEGPLSAGGFVWWRVRAPSGSEGWSVESADGVMTLVPYTTSNTPTAGSCVAGVQSGANLRTGPGTGFDVGGTAQAGIQLTVVSKSLKSNGRTWYQFENGLWAREDLLTLAGNCSNVPDV